MGSDPLEMMRQLSSAVVSLSNEVIALKEQQHSAESINRSPTNTRVYGTRGTGSSPPARVALHLPKFSGRGDYVAFEAQFHNVARQCQWDNRTMAEMLGCALEGSAQRFYARLPTHDRYDFQWLVLVLHKRYNSHVPETQRGKPLNRTRAPGQSMADLRDDIWRLVQESYPEMQYTFQESVALGCLKRAVDKELRLRFTDKSVKTLQGAVDLAEVYESVMRPNQNNSKKTVRAIQGNGEEKHLSHPPESTELTKMKQDINCLKSNMDKIQKSLDFLCRAPGGSQGMGPSRPNQNVGQTRPDRPRTYNNKPRMGGSPMRGGCFKCGQGDHWASECPKQNRRDSGNAHPPDRA